MKLLDKNIVKTLLNRFPHTNIKNLNIYNQSNCGNKILYNKSSKYYILKPKGKRSYIWFTYYEKKIMCILILLNHKNLQDISNEFYEINIKFDNTLCYNNVLLFGYYFKKNIFSNNKANIRYKKTESLEYFVIENVYNYNIYNYLIESNNYNNWYLYKLNLFSKILPFIHINTNTTKSVSFRISLPIIVNNVDEVFKLMNTIDYNIYCINVYSDSKYLGNYILNKSDNTNTNTNTNTCSPIHSPQKNNNISVDKFNRSSNNYNKLVATFKIYPCINNDLYNLYILDNNNEVFYDLALIDSYNNSVFMNKIFRNIKENRNLDLLEESDDEEEFENIDENKFVTLEKSMLIDCEYNYKFRKWMPRKISKETIIDKRNLQLILNKKKSFYNV
jgi:hypothetical protein